MSKNSARQTTECFIEWRSWAIAKKIIPAPKKKKPKPNFVYIDEI